ncbi:helix-turn-helix domain-containing protein [Amycolatopsis aidingensis]|uniref:helix-turn-helix domain-containing protein n=1 Tax=Amycolatopsis aidingensis TaxID=2842453 RepID=UPI001C0BE5EC|nr:AraC family transcriptional regulator [Amycolatopsis aidingensis]
MRPHTERGSGPLGSWELVRGAPHPDLRAQVRRYLGYAEHTSFTRRREVPTVLVPLIINLGPPLRVGGQAYRLGFLAGLSDSAGIVESGGEQACIQVDFTPLGARLLLDRPLRELTNRAADIQEAFGYAGQELVERLHAEPDWDNRFRLLDTFLGRRLASAAGVPPDLAWAWRRLARTAGALPVAALAAELGCSRKHLTARFTEHLGLPPKTLARILRFHGVVGELNRLSGPVRLAELAARHGYYDQAHLSREFRALAGLSPSEHLRRSSPEYGLIE